MNKQKLMNKQHLLEMFMRYIDFREDIVRQAVSGFTDELADKIMTDDDRWQEIVNYVYQEEEE
jgi:hypothetical protein